MSEEEKNLKDSSFEATRVDLGEDLLENSKSIASEKSVETLDEELQQGEILKNEKLFDDAKKVFRKILRNDPSNIPARKFLEEIQAEEIKELLAVDSGRKRFGRKNSEEDENPVLARERLEKDLRISFEKSELKPVPDLFKNHYDYEKYRDGVLKSALAVSVKHRIDLGIGHLEMGLYEVAAAVFETVIRYEDYKIEGMYLLGLSLIHAGKGIEATIRLEPWARDLTLSEVQKCGFLYLMGMAFEKLSDLKKAREFYRRAYLLNPKYRDVTEKINS